MLCAAAAVLTVPLAEGLSLRCSLHTQLSVLPVRFSVCLQARGNQLKSVLRPTWAQDGTRSGAAKPPKQARHLHVTQM